MIQWHTVTVEALLAGPNQQTQHQPLSRSVRRQTTNGPAEITNSADKTDRRRNVVREHS